VLAEDVLQKGWCRVWRSYGRELSGDSRLDEEAQGLAPMRGSKYVQSEIGDSYRQAEKLLKKRTTCPIQRYALSN
jgi:hypothetical protein